MEYDNIPTYTATRVDPDEPEPTGVFELRDCFDFRPRVDDSGTFSGATASTGRRTYIMNAIAIPI